MLEEVCVKTQLFLSTRTRDPDGDVVSALERIAYDASESGLQGVVVGWRVFVSCKRKKGDGEKLYLIGMGLVPCEGAYSVQVYGVLMSRVYVSE